MAVCHGNCWTGISLRFAIRQGALDSAIYLWATSFASRILLWSILGFVVVTLPFRVWIMNIIVFSLGALTSNWSLPAIPPGFDESHSRPTVWLQFLNLDAAGPIRARLSNHDELSLF